MTIYISGPMSGIQDLNYPLFNDVALALRMAGWDVINPAEIDHGKGATWNDCLRRDLVAMLDCDSIVMLPGWGSSKGARLELYVAGRLNMTVYGLKDLVSEFPASIPLGSIEGALAAV